MGLAENFAKKQELLARIRINLYKKMLCLAELEIWNDIEVQGIAPDTVASLTYDPAALPYPLRRQMRREHPRGHDPNVEQLADGKVVIKIVNVAILKDGTRVVLNPPLATAEERLKCPISTLLTPAVSSAEGSSGA